MPPAPTDASSLSPSPEFRALATPPSELFVPLLSPAFRALPPGTEVRPGDTLVRPLSLAPDAPLPLAPLPGVVLGTRDALLTSGRRVPSVVLQHVPHHREANPQVVTPPFTEQVQQLIAATPADLAPWPARLAAAGVWADRPTSPDLHAQLADASGVDTVVVTVLDPDPHLPAASKLAEDHPADLVLAALLAARLTGARLLLLVLETSLPERPRRELTRLLAEVSRLAGKSLSARTVPLHNHYPQGDTSLLLLKLLARKLPVGGLPTSRGVLLLDAATAIAVGRSLRHDTPLLHVPVAFADHLAETVHLLRVPVGTPLAHVVSALGLPPAATLDCRTGDVLQERRADPDAVISAADLYLHALPRPATVASPDPCIRCGWCVEACPTGVHPAAALEAAQLASLNLNPAKRLKQSNAHACIECGLCQFVCPSRLPLLSALRSAKTLLTKGGRP